MAHKSASTAPSPLGQFCQRGKCFCGGQSVNLRGVLHECHFLFLLCLPCPKTLKLTAKVAVDRNRK